MGRIGSIRGIIIIIISVSQNNNKKRVTMAGVSFYTSEGNVSFSWGGTRILFDKMEIHDLWRFMVVCSWLCLWLCPQKWLNFIIWHLDVI